MRRTPRGGCLDREHHASGYTMDTYVHLLEGGLGGADFLDSAVGGNKGATHDPQPATDEVSEGSGGATVGEPLCAH